MKVERIARNDVVALRADEALDAAWRRMRDQQLPALPVTDTTGRLVGVLTEHDLLARLVPRRAPYWWSVVFGAADQLAADCMKAVGVTVGEVMTEAPLTIAPDASLGQAATLMRQSEIGALPVVVDGACIGIVTRADVLDHLSWPAASRPGTVSDVELERAMREGIEQEAWASRHPLTVEAVDGVIRLTGVVASPVERAALLAMARSVAGCAGVEDRLIVLSRTSRYHTAPSII
jgi:CBS domain-containing protein